MIVSETPDRLKSRWLQACVLLCAVVVLPLGMVYAQDYEAVGKRLRAAVEAGEITGEQARVMLGTLRKASDAKKEVCTRDARPDWEAIKKRIEGAVERGDITREEADAKYKEIREKLAKQRAGKQ